MRKFIRLIAKDSSVFGRAMRNLVANLPFVSRSITLDERIILGSFNRIHYAYCLARSTRLAASLGFKKVTALEFGVAGGNGLVALEDIKEVIESFMPIKIRLIGFDMGSGLPSPKDYRDLPYAWQSGFYEMDEVSLRKRLKTAELVLGPVSQTLSSFISKDLSDCPIGMISFDLDYYSSTIDAFNIFKIKNENILPRVFCYMDDIMGTNECFSDFTGVRLAISEFNKISDNRKISPCHDFINFAMERWQEKVVIFHDFTHPLYNNYVGAPPAENRLLLRQ